MSDAVDLHFTYTEREYIAAVREHYQTFHTRVAAAFSLVIFLLGFGMWFVGSDAYASTIMMLGGLLFLLSYAVNFHLLPHRLYRRNPQFREAYHLRFSDEGLIFRSKDINSSFRWSFYKEVIEKSDFYYLFYGKDNYTLIPKRAFTSETQEKMFREIISRQTGGGFVIKGGKDGLKSDTEVYAPKSLEPPDWR